MRFVAILFALCMAPAMAHAEWHEASAGHFVVLADESPAKVKQIAEQLETFDKAMRSSYAVEDVPISPSNRVTVYFVPNQREVARLAGNSAVAGFYIPRAGRNIAVVPNRANGTLPVYNVLLHEYVHHFMFAIMDKPVPAWFREGIGEFWSTMRFQDDGSVMIGGPPDSRQFELFGLKPVPLDALLASRKSSLTISAIYGQGWLLTHYLMFEPSRKGQLDAYIAAINRGETSEKAAEAFGDLRKLQREVGAHLHRRVFQGSIVPAAKLKIAPVTVRKLTPGEAATIRIRIESDRGVSTEEAKGLAGRARSAAAPYPNDPGAQIVLAEAEYDAENYPAAEAAADRALAADPKAKNALVYKAMARIAVAEKAKDTKPETWKPIRDLIIRANRLEPDDPVPLMLFYRSFSKANEAPSASAKSALMRAHAVAPGDGTLRMEVARQLIWDNQMKLAGETLNVVAFDPHGGKTSDRARAAVEAIERGEKAEQVIAALDKKPEPAKKAD